MYIYTVFLAVQRYAYKNISNTLKKVFSIYHIIVIVLQFGICFSLKKMIFLIVYPKVCH